jgi:hypothetical protein
MLTCLVDATRYALPAISLVGLVIAAVAFVTNQPHRDRIDAILCPDSTPERSPGGYKAEHVQRVIERLGNAPAVDQKTPLGLYVSPVLYWNDIVFAVALAVFSASLWLWVLLQFEPSGVMRGLVIAFMICAVLYGVTDVAEDMTLARLFTQQTVSTNEARVASALTQAKFGTIVLSVTGALAFLVLHTLTPHYRCPPLNSPAPS